jgi:hypothetical protein
MNEDALRALIREAVARRLDPVSAPVQPPLRTTPVTLLTHASHYRYGLPAGDGPCLIEPAVTCNHCGYCQSHGH